jgi:hypothetical protein
MLIRMIIKIESRNIHPIVKSLRIDIVKLIAPRVEHKISA